MKSGVMSRPVTPKPITRNFAALTKTAGQTRERSFDMTRKTIFAAALAAIIAGGVFAQEYTIFLGGDVQGTVSVQKGRSGKITVTPNVLKGYVKINKTVCPVLPEDGFFVGNTTKNIVVDGNTTTTTQSDGSWFKTVVDRNMTTYTRSDGRHGSKTVADGNTLTTTWSDGSWEKQVLNGNTVTHTWSNGRWERFVVGGDGDTITETDSDGSSGKAVIDGNTTTVTGGGNMGRSYVEVIRGNTRTVTYSSGVGYREAVDGNTITKTSLDGKSKMVVEKQGNDIFVTKTGYLYGEIGVSERDRIRRAIDGIKSGTLKPEMLPALIEYGR
jgi:hypothetical protein